MDALIRLFGASIIGVLIFLIGYNKGNIDGYDLAMHPPNFYIDTQVRYECACNAIRIPIPAPSPLSE